MLKDLQNMERVMAGDIDGLRNIHVRSKQLVLRLQRLYPSILEQPILISSIIENKMSPECLRKWEEENTRRRREHTLPPPNQYVAWTLNWINDYIQTNKRSTVKMTFGNKENGDAKKSTNPSYATMTKKSHGSNGTGQVKTPNNFLQWQTQRSSGIRIKTTRVARDRVMKAGACINCLKTDHYVNKCKAGGCRIKGCGK